MSDLPPKPRRGRVGTVVWAMAAILLVALVALWLVLSAEPVTVGDDDLLAVPGEPEPTPLMTPRPATQEPRP